MLTELFNRVAAWPWSMFAAILAGSSLVMLWYVNIRRPYLRREALKAATETFFLVPSSNQHECTYALQNQEEHILKEISLRPNTETIVDLVVFIRQPFSFSEIGVGFLGDLDRKPYCLRYFNRYVAVGKGREVNPEDQTDDDFIDKHFYYHRRMNRTVSAGIVLSMAFAIKTREVGLFPLHLYFLSNEPIGKGHGCFITVEHTPTIPQICVDPKHKHLGCAIKGQPPQYQHQPDTPYFR